MKKQFFYLFGSLFLLWSCGQQTDQTDGEMSENDVAQATALDDYLLTEAKKFFRGEIPEVASNPDNEQTVAKEVLGQVLYYDNRLSKEGNISCNSCHNLATFGVDNLATSPGDGGENGDRNSPTVLNAALHLAQFWDGRAKDVEEQAGMPILNPIEMAIPHEQFLIDRLKSVSGYEKLFSSAFPEEEDPMTYANLRNAIAAFERTLITSSRFDAYLSGDLTTLSLEEKEGMEHFIKIGCTTCHNTILLGGKMYQKFGVHHDYWTYTKSTKIDEGRFLVTGSEEDKYKFKVPSLRNIAGTYPYFHDGSVEDLAEAVRIMAKTQLDQDITEEEAQKITTFLKALNGKVDDFAQKAPEVTPS